VTGKSDLKAGKTYPKEKRGRRREGWTSCCVNIPALEKNCAGGRANCKGRPGGLGGGVGWWGGEGGLRTKPEGGDLRWEIKEEGGPKGARPRLHRKREEGEGKPNRTRMRRPTQRKWEC